MHRTQRVLRRKSFLNHASAGPSAGIDHPSWRFLGAVTNSENLLVLRLHYHHHHPNPLSNPRILPPPNLTHSTTVVLVLSAQSNFHKRQAIRKTWAQGHDNVYFVVGHSNCHENMTNQMVDRAHCQEKENAFLIQEQSQFRDLIEVPKIEFYRGIPEKLVHAYHWSLRHLPLVRWLVKSDDDMFVRVQSVAKRTYRNTIPTFPCSLEKSLCNLQSIDRE